MHTIVMSDTPEARAIIAYHASTCNQFVTATGSKAEWSDAATPRTDKPVRFWRPERLAGGVARTWRFKELHENGSAIIPPFPRLA